MNLVTNNFSASMPVVVSKFLCDFAAASFSLRRHRRVRINKKWNKRYGMLYYPPHCTGKAYQVMGKLVVCPCVFKELEKLKEKQ